MWILRRTLTILFSLAVIFVGVVVLVRLNPAPSTLQQIGFGVCDGELCFRGVKIGMNWNQASAMLQEGFGTDATIEIGINQLPHFNPIEDRVVIFASPDKA
jgi:hypothetical protein